MRNSDAVGANEEKSPPPRSLVPQNRESAFCAAGIQGNGKFFFEKAFTLLEMLVSVAVLTLLLGTVFALVSTTSTSYQYSVGKVDVLEGARTGFDAMARALRQATLQSYLGYDDPALPTQYELKSDLHFISGPRNELGLATDSGTYSPHAVFFQAPLGVADSAGLQAANSLLISTGFFLHHGPEPNRPPPAVNDDRIAERFRYRLYQFIQPREESQIYSETLRMHAEGSQEFPVSVRPGDPTFGSTEWFSQARDLEFCHVLVENFIALAILPVFGSNPAPQYTWNSRGLDDSGRPVYSTHRLPQSLKVAMAVIEESSAQRIENGSIPPLSLPNDLFTDTGEFDGDLSRLEEELSAHSPPLNFRIFSTEIPLSTSDSSL